MAKAVHSMIRVLDAARSIAFYREVFGLEEADRFVFDDFTLIYLRNAEADFEVELTVNHGRTEPYDLGDGYGHIAFVTDDLEALHGAAKSSGYAPRDIKELAVKGERLARFFFIADPDGYQIEVIARGGRFR